ncbi:MAG TPA: hypothetical protein VN866_00645 [Mycobacterium sp.]|nr:hypothetical protein [Mycobacterium sp.]
MQLQLELEQQRRGVVEPASELELEELHAARTPSDSAATTAAAVRVRQ